MHIKSYRIYNNNKNNQIIMYLLTERIHIQFVLKVYQFIL